jgi:Ras-related protein Rab-7A
METRKSVGGGLDKKCFVKVVAIGDSAVGKTSLIQMFEHCKFTESFKPTIGADFSNKEITVNGRIVTLQIWDTAGQERYQSLGTAFYRGADCCLLVYDITNPQSFENLANWKQSFLQKGMVMMPESFPFIVVGNKVDMAEDNRQVSQVQL